MSISYQVTHWSRHGEQLAMMAAGEAVRGAHPTDIGGSGQAGARRGRRTACTRVQGRADPYHAAKAPGKGGGPAAAPAACEFQHSGAGLPRSTILILLLHHTVSSRRPQHSATGQQVCHGQLAVSSLQVLIHVTISAGGASDAVPLLHSIVSCGTGAGVVEAAPAAAATHCAALRGIATCTPSMPGCLSKFPWAQLARHFPGIYNLWSAWLGRYSKSCRTSCCSSCLCHGLRQLRRRPCIWGRLPRQTGV